MKLTEEQLEELVSDYFSESWAQVNAIHLLHHYAQILEKGSVAREVTDDDIWRIAQIPECHHGGDFAHCVDPIPFARALLSNLSAPVAGKDQKPVRWMMVERRMHSEPEYTKADPTGICESVYVPLYAAPQANLDQQVRDAQERVALWPQEKRDRMRLEGAEKPSNEE